MTKILNYISFLFIFIATTIGLSNCGKTETEKLEAAAGIVKVRPDSAYTILRDVDFNTLDTDSLKAKYIITKAIANVRIGRSLITDTLLNDAATYYISVGDTTNWVLAYQLLSDYDFIRGDYESALLRLENMVSRITNPELLWDSYIHMLEVSINSQNYTRACNYADWLMKHTNVPKEILRFGSAKGASLYFQGDFDKALDVFDSIVAAGETGKVIPKVSADFYCEYAEILDGAGHSSRAIDIIDSLNLNSDSIDQGEKINRKLALAQFHANSGDISKARKLLDSINLDEMKSVFELYASIAMLKAALLYKETGQFPSVLMHEVTKTMQRNYQLLQFDRQTAMESVIELNDDNYELKLQRQRLWLLVSGILFILIICGVIVYFILSRRKQRMVEAEERAETLERMLKDMGNAEKERTCTSDSDKLKATLLRQLGIFKTFAGTPTQQSRDALKKISSVSNDGTSIGSLVDWPEFYSMIDNLYNDFHTKLIRMYPETFNDKEQQIIVLLKAGFSTKEISVLTEQSSATIYTRKSVIRKKLGTLGNGDFIAQLEEQYKGI